MRTGSKLENFPLEIELSKYLCLYAAPQLCYNRAGRELFLEGVSALNSTALPSISPSHSFERQDEVFAHAFSILSEAIANRAFPAASVSITHNRRLVALKTLGRFTYDSGSPAVVSRTLFDLASLSKVIATTSMAMILYERGIVDLDAPVAAVVPEFVSGSAEVKQDRRRREITMRMLLAHASGLPAYEKLFLQARNREELLDAAFTVSLAADPGTRAEYSDIGFIILGVALERLADESLDRFCQREIFGPLAMTNTTYNPREDQRKSIPPTADDRNFRHRIIQGEVQDENASVLNGVAPHAGLFASAEDVAKFAEVLLHGGLPIFRSEAVALFTRRESKPEGTTRALGWDTPSPNSQSGKYFSAASFGHLGYTGTSLWIDPERQLSVTLLTNRTWPDCSNQSVKQIRPRFHDAVIEAIQPPSSRRDA